MLAWPNGYLAFFAEHPEFVDQPLYRETMEPEDIQRLKTVESARQKENRWAWWMKIMTPVAQPLVDRADRATPTLQLPPPHPAIVPATDLGGVGVLKHGNLFLLSVLHPRCREDSGAYGGAIRRGATGLRALLAVRCHGRTCRGGAMPRTSPGASPR